MPLQMVSLLSTDWLIKRKINNTARNSHGNLDFASGVNDENSFIGKGMKLDI